MPMNPINTGNDIRNSIPLNREFRESCFDVIEKFHFDDLFYKPGTLHESDDRKVRLDLQMRTKNGTVNLQVQTGQYSVAAVLVDPGICDIGDPVHQDTACEAIITILKDSLNTRKIWQLSGSLP